MEEFETVKLDTTVKAPNKSVKTGKNNATEENIGSTNHDNVIEKSKGDTENDSEVPENNMIKSEVVNTDIDYSRGKDNRTSPEAWTEPKN